MRDALSLLDQAIAHGAGSVAEASVREMLGAVDQEYLYALLDALAGHDGPAHAAHRRRRCRSAACRFEAALQDLATLLHRLALLQTVPDAVAARRARSRALAGAGRALLRRQDLQLDYQIALQGRADLWLAPDEYAGFTMTAAAHAGLRAAGERGQRREARNGRRSRTARIGRRSRTASRPRIAAIGRRSRTAKRGPRACDRADRPVAAGSPVALVATSAEGRPETTTVQRTARP